jgi:hypothetical protein
MTEAKSPRYPLSAEQIAAEYIEDHSRPGSARIYVLHRARFAIGGQDQGSAAAAPAAPEQIKEASAAPSRRLELGNIVIVLGGGAARALPAPAAMPVLEMEPVRWVMNCLSNSPETSAASARVNPSIGDERASS